MLGMDDQSCLKLKQGRLQMTRRIHLSKKENPTEIPNRQTLQL